MSAYLSLIGRRRGLALIFEAGHLLTFPAIRMGAYSRWALIQGWALIRINTVYQMLCFFSEISFFFLDILSGGCGSVGGFYREITHKFIESFS